MVIKTNNVPRHIILGYELTTVERAEFDYYTEAELDCGQFFRYRGRLFDLDEFMRLDVAEDGPLAEWHGYLAEGYGVGVLVKICDDGDSIIAARYYY